MSRSSQLRLGLCALITNMPSSECAVSKRQLAYLEDTIKFCRQHHVSFRFEPPGHERLLSRRLSVRDVHKRLVRQDDRNVRFETKRLCISFLHNPRLLQIDSPERVLPCGVLDLEFEDAVVLRIDAG